MRSILEFSPEALGNIGVTHFVASGMNYLNPLSVYYKDVNLKDQQSVAVANRVDVPDRNSYFDNYNPKTPKPVYNSEVELTSPNNPLLSNTSGGKKTRRKKRKRRTHRV